MINSRQYGLILATLLVLTICLYPLVSAEYADCQIYGNCAKPAGINNYNNSYTTINNTFINQTVNATVNTTQFDSNNPIHIKESWLTNFIEIIVESYNYLTETQADSLYCKLTGCTMNGNINLNNYNITNATFLNNKNVSQIVTGNMSSESITTTVTTTCTGGTETFDGEYSIRTFTSSGSFSCDKDINATILVIGGGGGGGGGASSGGGGAGGMAEAYNWAIPSGAYDVKVGLGGAGGNAFGNGANGQNSSFMTIVGVGGGAGPSDRAGHPTGYPGGSGGGGANTGTPVRVGGISTQINGTGWIGYGFAGGNGPISGSPYPGGGGGGAGGDGQTPSAGGAGGNGGIGRINNITGTDVCYAGGGGGAERVGSAGMGVATCGGGNASLTGVAGAGIDGLGGGGGAIGDGTGDTGGKGGSGIVIIRYKTNQSTTVLGAKGLMPYVSATNFISTDNALQWNDATNTLLNIWNTITTLGNSTNRFNINAWNVDAVNITATNICYSNGTNCNITTDNLSGYVPYTGATSNVNLNGKNLSNVNLTTTNKILIGNKTTITSGVDMELFGTTGTTGTSGTLGGGALYTGGNGGGGTSNRPTASGAPGGSFTFYTGNGGYLNNTGSGASISGGTAGTITYATGVGGTGNTNGVNSVTGGTGGFIKFGAINYGTGGEATTTTTGTNTGGVGAYFEFRPGIGGLAQNGALNYGGNGGYVNFYSSTGGNAISTSGKNATGGNGGNYVLSSGNGGSASGAGYNRGGNGGNVSITAGVAGTGTTANGANGNILFKVGTTESFRVDGTTANLWLSSDNRKAIFGASSSSSIYYDGTNMIINPKEVGSGQLKILGTTNVTESLIVKDNINQTNGNATINTFYAGMHFHNDSGVAIALNSTLQKVNLFKDIEYSNGFTKLGNDTLQMNVDGGVYQVHYELEIYGVQNHEYEAFIFVNETQQMNTYGRTIGQASSNVDLRGFGFIRINSGQNMTLRVADKSGTTSGSAYIGNINLVRVGN